MSRHDLFQQPEIETSRRRLLMFTRADVWLRTPGVLADRRSTVSNDSCFQQFQKRPFPVRLSSAACRQIQQLSSCNRFRKKVARFFLSPLLLSLTRLQQISSAAESAARVIHSRVHTSARDSRSHPCVIHGLLLLGSHLNLLRLDYFSLLSLASFCNGFCCQVPKTSTANHTEQSQSRDFTTKYLRVTIAV